ncbi:MAG: hypothetical protein K8F34_16070, partial [Candidatus Kuenenia stuttgartiensis]|nr:hypothetical protein [Candidatus Kuenenia stuttgartiensis]
FACVQYNSFNIAGLAYVQHFTSLSYMQANASPLPRMFFEKQIYSTIFACLNLNIAGRETKKAAQRYCFVIVRPIH